MPQPSSRTEAEDGFPRAPDVKSGLEGEASQDAKVGVIFHRTAGV